MDMSIGLVEGEVPRDDAEGPEPRPEAAAPPSEIDPLLFRREKRRLERRDARLRAT